MRNTWVLTSAAAVQTRRVQLGGVGINPYTNDPCEIATYAATLDELSSGRCIIGLGMHTADMVQWTGIDVSDHVRRTREPSTSSDACCAARSWRAQARISVGASSATCGSSPCAPTFRSTSAHLVATFRSCPAK